MSFVSGIWTNGKYKSSNPVLCYKGREVSCSQVGRTLGWVLTVIAPYTKTVVLGIRVLMARNVQGI